MAKQKKKPAKAKRERVDTPKQPSGSAEYQIRNLIREAICAAQAVAMAMENGSHELAVKLRKQQQDMAEEADKYDPDHKCELWRDYDAQLKKTANPKKPTVADVRASEDSPAPPYPGAGVTVNPEPDDDPIEDDGLTMRQRLFVRAITGPALGNATKAAEMAGYRSENNVALRATAYENLTKPHIQRAISAALTNRLRSKEWADTALVEMARGSMADFVTVDAAGRMTADFAKAAAAGALGQIREIEISPDTGTITKLKLYDALKAREILLRRLGMLKDAVELSGPDGGPVALLVDAGLVRNNPDDSRASQSSGDAPAGNSVRPTTQTKR